MTDMTTYVIPQRDVFGFYSGKPYLALDADDNHVLVENENGVVYAFDRIHDERFQFVDTLDVVEHPTDRDMCNKYQRDVAYLEDEVCELESVIIAMVREKYLEAR